MLTVHVSWFRVVTFTVFAAKGNCNGEVVLIYEDSDDSAHATACNCCSMMQHAAGKEKQHIYASRVREQMFLYFASACICVCLCGLMCCSRVCPP